MRYEANALHCSLDRAAVEGIDAEPLEGHGMDRRRYLLARALGWREADPNDPVEPVPPRLGME